MNKLFDHYRVRFFSFTLLGNGKLKNCTEVSEFTRLRVFHAPLVLHEP
jgi:hypothetical protein